MAENLEHIILTERFVLGALNSPQPYTPDPARRSRWDGRDEAFIRKLTEGREDRFTAPEALHPTGRWPAEALVTEFEAARVLTRAFAASTELDLRSRIVRHPAPPIGDIDAYQLLMMIGAHCERHRAQCEEVLASRIGRNRPDR